MVNQKRIILHNAIWQGAKVIKEKNTIKLMRIRVLTPSDA